MSFASDTTAPAHPAVLEALAEVNAGPAPSYGADDATTALRAAVCEVFETEVEVWPCVSGTAANALALSVLCPPTGAILCHAEAHIARDERGAPEFFTGGGKLQLLPGEHALIAQDALDAALAARAPDFVHETPAHVLSLTNLTESGAALSPDAVGARAGPARAEGLWVHMDGARFANALVSTAARPADLTWRAGVDVLTLGFTKNGALGLDVIVLFDRAKALKPELDARAKRAGHMPPKLRYLSAQGLALLKGELWLDLARHANAMARRLADGLTAAGAALAHPVDGNEVFVNADAALLARLKATGAMFYPWIDADARLVCSWATNTSEVDAFVAAARTAA